MDLDINNYDVDDLLNLFNINYNFNNEDLRKAYKKTLMTHPDKSGLDKEYFLFFTKAFKKLKFIYDFRNKQNICVESTNYNYDYDKDMTNNIKIKTNKTTIKADKNFNKRFNELFEKVKIYDEEQDNGYDEWIKNNPIDEDNKPNITNVRSLNEYIENKKQEARELIKYKDVKEINSSVSMGNNSNLMREKPEYYESGIFSKMQYEDYKRAHTETVIPVTEEDYINKVKFNNVNQLMTYRKQEESVSSLEQSKQLLERKKELEEKETMNIAYNLSKQMEQIKKSREIYNANFNLLLG